MFKRVTFVAVLAILIAAWSAFKPEPEPRPPYVSGRKNSVLFLTAEANGLSNVLIASSFALLEKHPEVEVHYASYPKLAKEIARVSKAALAKNSAAKPITWHELSGPGYIDVASRPYNGTDSVSKPPGLKGMTAMMKDIEFFLSPWEAHEHWEVYQEMHLLVEELDPAVIVLDQMFRPAMDVVRNMNRAHVVVVPNALTDAFVFQQPWGAMLWKYPVLASGHPFPVPWSLIPKNIYLQIRLIMGLINTPYLELKRTYLKERGVKDPINFVELHRDDVPWLSASLPAAELPLSVIPPNVTSCGPIVLDVAPAEEQDPELAAWLKNAPTMLVNLGSTVRYTREKAVAMAEALVTVFEATDTQVVWKFRKDVDPYDDEWRKPIEKYIANGRLRLESWLNVDPMALLNTGDIAVSVHHGGANCYFETVLSGVPQVVLPLWVDLYNFAQIAEYLGIGVWPGQDTAPVWDAKSLSDGFLKALSDESMREKAKTLGDIAKTYGGRDVAANVIAGIAANGH